MRKGFLTVMIILTTVVTTSGQVKNVPKSFCISEIENRLYMMVNEYRGRYDLPQIPLSKSLCYVASLHVKDLEKNHPDKGTCNSHSWSDKGNWKPFCYPADENKKNSVWDKPKELTSYPSKGYEIIYWDSETLDPDSILSMWKSVEYFNNFLTNTGKWQGKKWNAFGIAIYGSYVSAWFGEAADPEGISRVCGTPEPVAEVKSVTPEQGKASVKKSPVDTVKRNVKAKPVNVNDSAAVSGSNIGKLKTGVYYIIVKSQQPMAVMQKSQQEAVKKGFSDAMIMNGDKLRLSVAEFRQKAAADSALREIRKVYRDAWILVK